jgi:hypothetical protein
MMMILQKLAGPSGSEVCGIRFDRLGVRISFKTWKSTLVVALCCSVYADALGTGSLFAQRSPTKCLNKIKKPLLL